ncbi:MAG: FapA family protein [Candidatus Cloacimonadaceae bacterium]
MENIIYSQSGNVSLRINPDKMSAWLYIHNSGKFIDEKEILDLIKGAGICYGFEEALEWMAANNCPKDFENPFPVALCKSSIHLDRVKLFFNKEKAYNPSLDIKAEDLSSLPSVKKDDILAEISYNLFTDDSSVYNIFGELTPDLADSSFPSDLIGENVRLDEDNKRILADISGLPYADDNGKINVTDKIIFKGDINSVTQPLNLPYSLFVEGSIRNSSISTEGDLIVQGDIIASEIRTEGNLTVESIISDCDNTGVYCKGNIKVKSIFNSFVLSEGEISFEQEISSSRVIAEKGVWGIPVASVVKKSQILTAGIIDIANAGDENNNPTDLEVTISPLLKEKIIRLRTDFAQLLDDSVKNADEIDFLKEKLQEAENILATAIEAYLEKSSETKRFIKIRNQLFKNVYLRVLNKTELVKTDQIGKEIKEE